MIVFWPPNFFFTKYKFVLGAEKPSAIFFFEKKKLWRTTYCTLYTVHCVHSVYKVSPEVANDKGFQILGNTA